MVDVAGQRLHGAVAAERVLVHGGGAQHVQIGPLGFAGGCRMRVCAAAADGLGGGKSTGRRPASNS